MLLFNSKFRKYLKSKRLFVLIGFLLVFSGITPVVGSSTLIDEKRRVGRVQAAYLTHLINFTKWNQADLPKSEDTAKFVILGADSNGVVDSIKFLVAQRKLKIDGRDLEIIHFENNLDQEAKLELAKKPQVVFILSESTSLADEVKTITPNSLLIGVGRNIVEKSPADIAFMNDRNRVRLIINEKTFSRKSPKISSRISTLRNVVEIVPAR